MAIRPVRFQQSFFDDLDSLLPTERSSEGIPSSTDFLLYDLPRLRDLLAADFEQNTRPVEEAEPVRVLIQAGTLVRSVVLYAIEASDGAVAVIALDLDVGSPGAGADV